MKSGASVAGDLRGRGWLRLCFEKRVERTVLAEKFASAPFGAVRANYPDGFGMAEVQITNPSGGILGGDQLEVEVVVTSGAVATVLTQAANKAYRGTESSQHAVFRVEGGALLEYLPHHLIPYPNSDYRQTTLFHLVPDAALIAWDAFSAGRVARGERFAFTRLRGRMEIRVEGVPKALDGFDLPGDREPFGGYSYAATAYVLAPRNLEPLVDVLHHHLAGGMSDALASASVPAQGLCVVRVLATGAQSLYAALNGFRDLSRKYLELPAPARKLW